MKKLLALDIDGTLLNQTTPLHPDWRKHIATFEDEGHITTLISGRLPTGMAEAAHALGIPEGRLLAGADGATFAACNGVGGVTRRTTHEIPYDALRPLLRQTKGLILTPEQVFQVGAVNDVMAHLARITAPEVSSLDTWQPVDDPVVGLRFLLPRQEGLELFALLEERQDILLQLFDNKEFSKEYVGIALRPPGRDKGDALTHLAELYGVEKEHTLALGDWVTDIAMLEVAGNSSCPSDALPMVKASAKKVSDKEMTSHWALSEFISWAGL